jgi:hypothetical protein
VLRIRGDDGYEFDGNCECECDGNCEFVETQYIASLQPPDHTDTTGSRRHNRYYRYRCVYIALFLSIAYTTLFPVITSITLFAPTPSLHIVKFVITPFYRVFVYIGLYFYKRFFVSDDVVVKPGLPCKIGMDFSGVEWTPAFVPPNNSRNIFV